MVPYNYTGFQAVAKQLIAEKRVSMSRIDDAVTRIVRVKFQMGLFEKPFADKSLQKYLGASVSAPHSSSLQSICYIAATSFLHCFSQFSALLQVFGSKNSGSLLGFVNDSRIGTWQGLQCANPWCF